MLETKSAIHVLGLCASLGAFLRFSAPYPCRGLLRSRGVRRGFSVGVFSAPMATAGAKGRGDSAMRRCLGRGGSHRYSPLETLRRFFNAIGADMDDEQLCYLAYLERTKGRRLLKGFAAFHLVTEQPLLDLRQLLVICVHGPSRQPAELWHAVCAVSADWEEFSSD
jgi:hypothetical protein